MNVGVENHGVAGRTGIRPHLAWMLAASLAGCVAADPETAPVTSAPQTPVAKTFTSFTPALQCMDDLLLAAGKQDITITTPGIRDATQKAMADTKEMLVTALATMSRKSRAFSFIDYDREHASFFVDAQRASGMAGFKVPSYFIRGAITQMDDSVLGTQWSAAITPPWAGPKDQIVSMVALDLNLGETVSRQIIADAGSSNAIAVVRVGTGNELGHKIGAAGVVFNIAANRSEGLGGAIRTLMELGLIETIGQFTHVPYWKCLEIEKTNPKARETARDWYDSMKPEEQIAFVQRKLAGLGVYAGGDDGKVSPALVSAAAEYQVKNRLVADGRVNFELFYSLLNDDVPPPLGTIDRVMKAVGGR